MIFANMATCSALLLVNNSIAPQQGKNTPYSLTFIQSLATTN